MKKYNGHRSWNAWNVALWMGNDEPLYNFALECIGTAKIDVGDSKRRSVAGTAALMFISGMGNPKTPDGATFNHLAVKLAMEGFME